MYSTNRILRNFWYGSVYNSYYKRLQVSIWTFIFKRGVYQKHRSFASVYPNFRRKTLKYVKNHTKGYIGKASNHIAQAKKLSNLKSSTAFAKCRRRVVSSLVIGYERPVSRTRSPQNEGEQLAKGTSTEVDEILTHKIGLCLASFIPSSCSTFRLETITQTLTVWSIIQQNKYSLS